MSNEAKCNCQRCGEHIAFPIEITGQEIICPHCGRETTLLLPEVRKADSNSNASAPRGKPKSEMPNATMVLLGIIGLTVIIVPVALLLHHQAYVAECDRNFRELTNITPTFSEIEKARSAAAAKNTNSAPFLPTSNE